MTTSATSSQACFLSSMPTPSENESIQGKNLLPLEFCSFCSQQEQILFKVDNRTFQKRSKNFFNIVAYTEIQSTLIISNSKGLSETLRDIRTSTYQIFRIEEKINGTTTFNKFICNWTLNVRDISKILWKRGEYFYLLDFHV